MMRQRCQQQRVPQARFPNADHIPLLLFGILLRRRGISGMCPSFLKNKAAATENTGTPFAGMPSAGPQVRCQPLFKERRLFSLVQAGHSEVSLLLTLAL
jgi:hypothetical protein